MTDDAIISAVVAWFAGITGKTVIRANENGPRPPLPYIMVNFTGSAPIRDHEQIIEYFDTGVPNSEGENEIRATPVIETEWRFSIHAFDETSPSDLLRPVVSAARLSQKIEPLLPSVTIHSISQLRDIPEWVNAAWEPRANMDFFLHGLTRDGFIVDTIDDIHVNIERMGT